MNDLVEERDFLLRSLADLDEERSRGDISDADYAALRDDYTARAAAVIRALEGDSARAAVVASPPRPRRRRSLVAAVTIVAFAGLAGVLVASTAGERLPGDQATGAIELGPTEKLARAQQLVSEGRAVDAIRLYDEVLAEDPEGRTRAIALAQRGWLISRAAAADPSLVDKGLAQIEQAIAADPTYADARFFKAMLLLRDKDDPVGAIAEFRAFLATDPPPGVVSFVEGELRRAIEIAEARGLEVPDGEGAPAPGEHPR